MNRRICHGIIFLALAFLSYSSFADGESVVASIPHAISSKNIYKAEIIEIDGVATGSARDYPLTPGQHTIRVRMMLVVDWTPKLPGASDSVREKEIVLNIEPGTKYQIAAKLDIDAPIESQLDGSYWEPVVYDKFPN
ncbi:hypothetical protein ACFL1V_00110 [Pseudomonadota bacterium]